MLLSLLYVNITSSSAKLDLASTFCPENPHQIFTIFNETDLKLLSSNKKKESLKSDLIRRRFPLAPFCPFLEVVVTSPIKNPC